MINFRKKIKLKLFLALIFLNLIYLKKNGHMIHLNQFLKIFKGIIITIQLSLPDQKKLIFHFKMIILQIQRIKIKLCKDYKLNRFLIQILLRKYFIPSETPKINIKHNNKLFQINNYFSRIVSKNYFELLLLIAIRVLMIFLNLNKNFLMFLKMN